MVQVENMPSFTLTNHKAKQDAYVSCFLSLEGKEGQKAKATGTIKEIPENLSYIKTN